MYNIYIYIVSTLQKRAQVNGCLKKTRDGFTDVLLSSKVWSWSLSSPWANAQAHGQAWWGYRYGYESKVLVEGMT